MTTTQTFRTALRRCCASSAIIAAVTVATATAVLAFGTVNLLGQHAEHEKITRLGLASFGLGPKTMSEIAGKSGTFGAVGAPDHPARGLMSRADAHCDGADAFAGHAGYPQSPAQAAARLSECRAWIKQHLEAAVRSAGDLVTANGTIRSSEIPTFISCTYNGKPGRAKCNVLEALGLALHASQDFYSHTNWTDRSTAGAPSLSNPPGLAQSGPAPWLDPSRNVAYPAGLISGCFEGIPESAHCRGRIRHADLNKDKGNIDPGTGAIGLGGTPRGAANGNFANAVRAAVVDTTAKWRYFEQRVQSTYGRTRGAKIVCVMRKDTPDGC